LLINLQPFARPMKLEVLLGEERHVAGIAEDNEEKRHAMKASLRRVAGLAEEGLFALRHEVLWEFEMIHTAPDDWAEFVNKPTFGRIEADQELLDAAMSRPDGNIILTEEDLLFVYEKKRS